MYMGALSVSRFHPKLKKVYRDLLAKGKEKKVALAALIRRMIVILNAKARDIILQHNFA